MVQILPPFKVKTPDYTPGMSLSIAPSGHQLWLGDYIYYDQLGRDPMQLRKMWLIEDPKQRLETFKEIVQEYPTAKHRRQMLLTMVVREDEDCIRHLLSTGLLVHPDIEQAKKDRKAYEEAKGQPGFEEDPDNPPDIADPTCAPLHVAASKASLSIFRMMVEDGKSEVDCRDEVGRTLLHAAAAAGKIEHVNYLLGRGADPTLRTYRDDKIAVRYLGDYAGADVLEMSLGRGRGNLDIVRVLLEHPFHGSTRKRKWTETSESGVWVTPLAIKAAAGCRNHETLKFLLERGGYPVEDRGGRTKGDLLNEDEREVIREILPIVLDSGDYESTNFLLSYFHPVNDKGQVVPFQVPEDQARMYTYGTYGAAVLNDTKKFRFLHSFGIKEHDTMSLDEVPDGQTVNIQNILDRTAMSGAVDCAKLVVQEFGADPNKHRFPSGIKPLFAAAAHDKTEYMRWLLEDQKVDIHAGTGRYVTGPTALWVALYLRSISCIELLLQHGGPLDHIDEELKHMSEPVTAILSARLDEKSGATTVRVETESNAKDFVDNARNDFMRPASRYVRIELAPEDQPFIDNLVTRLPAEKRYEKEKKGEHGPLRELSEEEGAKDDEMDGDDPRRLVPPIPTFPEREALVKEDIDLYPEFKPFLMV